MLVDSESDLMCFLIIDPSDSLNPVLRDYLDFHIYLPNPLKVHDSIYDLVGDLPFKNSAQSNKSSSKELNVAFQAEYFQIEQLSSLLSEAPKSAEDHFHDMINSLSSYPENPFEKFFWTSEATKSFFELLPASVTERSGEYTVDVERYSFI